MTSPWDTFDQEAWENNADLLSRVRKLEAEVRELSDLRELILETLKLQRSVQPLATIELINSILPILDKEDNS